MEGDERISIMKTEIVDCVLYCVATNPSWYTHDTCTIRVKPRNHRIIVARTKTKTNVTCCGHRNPDSRGMSTTRMFIEHCVSYVSPCVAAGPSGPGDHRRIIL